MSLFVFSLSISFSLSLSLSSPVMFYVHSIHICCIVRSLLDVCVRERVIDRDSVVDRRRDRAFAVFIQQSTGFGKQLLSTDMVIHLFI